MNRTKTMTRTAVTGKKYSFVAHLCEGMTNGSGHRIPRRCNSWTTTKAANGKWYCPWHHPDPKQRAVSRLSPKHPLNKGKAPLFGVKAQAQKRVQKKRNLKWMRDIPKAETSVLTPSDPGGNFAASLSALIDTMVRDSLVRVLTK